MRSSKTSALVAEAGEFPAHLGTRIGPLADVARPVGDVGFLHRDIDMAAAAGAPGDAEAAGEYGGGGVDSGDVMGGEAAGLRRSGIHRPCGVEDSGRRLDSQLRSLPAGLRARVTVGGDARDDDEH